VTSSPYPAPRAAEAARRREDTAALLAALGAERVERTAEQRSRAAAFAEALRHSCERLLAQLAAERAAAATAQRQELARATNERRAASASRLAELRASRHERHSADAAGRAYAAQARAAAEAERRAAARGHAAARAAEAEARRGAVAAQLAPDSPAAPPAEAPASPAAPPARPFGHAGLGAYAQQVRVSVARELEAARGPLTPARQQTIGAFIENLAGSVAGMLRDLDGTRAAMGQDQLAQAADQIDAVRRNVTALQRELEAAGDPAAARLARSVAAIAEDVDLAYLSVSNGPGQRPRRPHPGPSNDIRDDLTRIKGIGPGTQARLNQAGIVTYIQVALSAPEDLRRILGGSASRLANVEDWIAQARGLAGAAAEKH
jgi:predicted flap endonuclease-1-like 5' DNA nuclease